MSNKIVFKRSAVAGKIPTVGDLSLGEIALNTYDGKAYIKQDNGTQSIIQLGSTAADLGVISNTFVGTGSQTVFILSRSPMTSEYTFITINGLIQESSSYSVSSTTLTFSTAPDLNDSIEVRILYGNSASISLRDYKKYIFNIIYSTSTITGTDSNGYLLVYDVGYVDVYQNGIRLVEGDDYIANTGTSIALTLSVNNTDTIEVLSYGRAYIADTAPIIITATTANTIIDSYSTSLYRSAKYDIQISDNTGYHVIEIRSLHDSSNSYITQYGEMYTAGSLGTFSANTVSGNTNLYFTPTAGTSEVTFNRTLLTVGTY